VPAPRKFLQNNQDKFQTNSALCSLHARIKYHVYRPAANVCLERSLYHAGIRIFKSLPCRLTSMLNEKTQFKVALRCLHILFFSVDQFLMLKNDSLSYYHLYVMVLV
jgi:hypothetical protein